jgi:hypothetical protein
MGFGIKSSPQELIFYQRLLRNNTSCLTPQKRAEIDFICGSRLRGLAGNR